jgi:quinoprotein glucose dehydrogenase
MTKHQHWKLTLLLTLLVGVAAFVQRHDAANGPIEWPAYGGGKDNTHYSPLKQINRGNVKNLQVAWQYDTGDAFEGSEMQCNPLIVKGVLYATSPKLRVFALDAATGKQRWSFDPHEGRKALGKFRNRGVTYWESANESRIFFGFNQWLYALDAQTGLPDKTFGTDGRVDLRLGLDRPDAKDLSVGISTPGVIYRDLLIVGSIVSEMLPAAPGHIRAYELRTGKLRWIFHTIPLPGEFGYETWPKEAWQYVGGTNAWSGLTLDEKRGLLFAPTGSATYDFYGANRHGDNLFANSLLCLDAATGKRKWHFQTVRHDLWDRDLPTAPALVTVKQNGRLIDAVAQTTKAGHIFVFERETGKPLFPIENRKVSTQGVDGEQLADTQPVPLLPPPVARQQMTEAMLTKRTPAAHAAVLAKFKTLTSTGQFEPPNKNGVIVTPGFDGGPGWGGAAVDPAGMLYVNASEVPCILKLIEQTPRSRAQSNARNLYDRSCASCHGRDLAGTPPEFPALTNLSKKYNAAELRTVIRNGFGRMPGFASSLNEEAIQALITLLLKGENVQVANTAAQHPAIQQKYVMEGYPRFLDPDGYPAIEPPWGTLTAVDLNKGAIAWQIPLGEYPELSMKDTGSWNYGGPIVTAGGLVFIGATNYDKKFRAFDKDTGKLLWETLMPFAGNATPATYEVNGKQFVVIAAGGGKRGAPSGGVYVAYALPQR